MSTDLSGRIVLGTAQFGMDYGINNKAGILPKKESFEILERALDRNIDIADTAYTYGCSEAVLGEFMRTHDRGLRVISKTSGDDRAEVERRFETTLKRLGSDRLYGYLVHDFKSYETDSGIWDLLMALKKDGRAEAIGFSLYYPEELKKIFDDGLSVDIIQIPFSVFDQRFSEYLPEAKRRGIRVFARSVFLQGAVFKDPERLDRPMAGLREKLMALDAISEEMRVPISSICSNFVLCMQGIDNIVIGVDGVRHLNGIIEGFEHSGTVRDNILRLAGLAVDDEKLVVPVNWKV